MAKKKKKFFLLLCLLYPLAAPFARSCKPGAVPTTRRKRTKSKRAKQIESSDSAASQCRQQQQQPPRLNQGLNMTSWSPSGTSQSMFTMAYPSMIQPFPPVHSYSRASSAAPRIDATLQGGSNSQSTQAHACPSSINPAPYTASMVTPIVALVLPNYMYPPLAAGLPPQQPMYHAATAGFPTQMQSFGDLVTPFLGHVPFSAPPPVSFPNQFNSQHRSAPQVGSLTPSFCFPPTSEAPKVPMECQSRSTTPQSGRCGDPASPPMFQSGCSSPLNLLELELSVDRQDSIAPSSGGHGNNMAEREKGASGTQAKERELKQVNTVICLVSSSFFISPHKYPNDGFSSQVTFITAHDKNANTSTNIGIFCCLNSWRYTVVCSSEMFIHASLSPSGSNTIGSVIPRFRQLYSTAPILLPMYCRALFTVKSV